MAEAARFEVLNPWEERALEWLDRPLGRFLDYGCGPCRFLNMVQNRCEDCHGVDVDEALIQSAQKNHPHFKLGTLRLDGRTEYPDGYFDTVALLEVIEHVPDERQTLAEIARVLKPGGSLLLTTPHRGLLTFLDAGNFKFVFPGLHQFIHRRVLAAGEEYEERFGRVGGRELIGDISVSANRRPWHRHYKPREIERFAEPSLVPQATGVYFPAMRAIGTMRMMLRVLTRGKIQELPRIILRCEKRLSEMQSSAGDQLVMLLTKR